MDVDAFETVAAEGGIELHHLGTDKYKAVHVGLALTRPLDEHTAARALLGDLLTRGTASRPSLAALAARCEELYDTELHAHASAFGADQVVGFGLTTVADRYADGETLVEQAAALLAEALHAPPLVDGAFRADHVATERRNLAHAIASLADDKGHLARRRLLETMFGDSPFARHPWGRADEAEALTDDELPGVWRDLARAAPARLFVVGDVPRATALAIADVLADGARRPAPAAAGLPPPRARGPVRQGRLAEPLAQSKLAIGYRVDPAVLPGAAPGLLASVLGGGSHSRLFKRVREAEGLAYGCGARLLPDRAALVVQAGIDAAAAPRVQQVVAEELARLADEPVPAEELEVARTLGMHQLEELHDSPRALMAFRLRGLATGRASRVGEAVEALSAVRAEDVRRVAAGLEPDAFFLLEGTGP